MISVFAQIKTYGSILDDAAIFFVATAVLHNFAIRTREAEPQEAQEYVERQASEALHQGDQNNAYRQRLVDNCFAHFDAKEKC